MLGGLGHCNLGLLQPPPMPVLLIHSLSPPRDVIPRVLHPPPFPLPLPPHTPEGLLELALKQHLGHAVQRHSAEGLIGGMAAQDGRVASVADDSEHSRVDAHGLQQQWRQQSGHVHG